MRYTTHQHFQRTRNIEQSKGKYVLVLGKRRCGNCFVILEDWKMHLLLIHISVLLPNLYKSNFMSYILVLFVVVESFVIRLIFALGLIHGLKENICDFSCRTSFCWIRLITLVDSFPHS